MHNLLVVSLLTLYYATIGGARMPHLDRVGEGGNGTPLSYSFLIRTVMTSSIGRRLFAIAEMQCEIGAILGMYLFAVS